MAAEIPESFDFDTEFAEEAPPLLGKLAEFRQAQDDLHDAMTEFAEDSSTADKWWRVAARRNELSAAFDESVNALVETEPDHELLSKSVAGLIYESDDTLVDVIQKLQPSYSGDDAYPTLRECSPDHDKALLEIVRQHGKDALLEEANETFGNCLADSIECFKDRAILHGRGDI